MMKWELEQAEISTVSRDRMQEAKVVDVFIFVEYTQN